MRTFKMLIPGEPGSMVSEQKAVIWDNCRHRKCVSRIELERQFEEAMFNKPITLDLMFFISPPRDIMQSRLVGKQHDRLPHLSSMIRFLTDAARGVLYTNERIIYSVTAKKFYSIHPRTEMLVTEQEENHGSREREIKELDEKRRKEKESQTSSYFKNKDSYLNDYTSVDYE